MDGINEGQGPSLTYSPENQAPPNGEHVVKRYPLLHTHPENKLFIENYNSLLNFVEFVVFLVDMNKPGLREISWKLSNYFASSGNVAQFAKIIAGSYRRL